MDTSHRFYHGIVSNPCLNSLYSLLLQDKLINFC